MPILEIEIVGGLTIKHRKGLAQRLADGAAKIMSMPPGSTWVRLRRLDAADYAENGGLADPVLPVFVSLLRADPPTGEALDREVLEMSQMVGSLCERPVEQIHVRVEPAGRGRQAFGGKVYK